MTIVLLFIIGIAVGSFLNVVALRYKPSGKLFGAPAVLGRSYCPTCRKKLSWYELIPLLSFFAQLGKCRSCNVSVSWQYPIVELLSGLTFAFVPFYFLAGEAFIWILVILALILLSLIDLRRSIIPDQLNIFLAFMGAVLIITNDPSNFQIWLDALIGLAVGAGLLGLVFVISKGRAMGFGDVKLAAALGFLFGWPQILMILAAAFILGGLVSVIALILKHKTIKDALPFGPFIALAAVGILFIGDVIVKWFYGLL